MSLTGPGTDPREGKSIPACLAEAASRFHERPAVWYHDGTGFQPVSHDALIAGALQMGAELTARGVRPGDRVALWLPNRYRWMRAYLGILWSGATVVPIDPGLTPDEIRGILADADVRLMVAHDAGAVAALGVNLEVVPDAHFAYPDRVDGIRSADAPPKIDPGSLAVIIYTSGTTGTAKGVMLTHANITSNIQAITRMCLASPEDKFLSVLPVHHAFEATAGLLYPLSIGAQVAYARSLKSNEILADLRASQATLILGVPLLFEKMEAGIRRKVAESSSLRRGTFAALMTASRYLRALGWKSAGRVLFAGVRRQGGLDSIRILVTGGAAILPETVRFFDLFGMPMLQGYGLSEASPVVSVNRLGEHRYNTVGPPLPGIDVRIIDPGPDGAGEISVGGPNIMRGYWNRPEETGKVLIDGRLLTGDLGLLDADGHLRIVGRSKNLIVSAAGKNIYPEELESLLDAQPEIGESLVYGKARHGRIGETVSAIIVPDADWLRAAGIATDDASLRAALRPAVERACASLAAFKRITDWEVQLEPFERTSSRKIKRHAVLRGRRTGPV